MFGYIRPMQSELRVRELERFRACYCGLCHTLGKKYGPASRFVLNFELVFLAMLLWDENDKPTVRRRRCIASPFRKRACCAQNVALDVCAGYSVILSWWKLKDTVADESFFKSLPYRIIMLFLLRAYKKAANEFSDFDEKVRESLKELAGHETGKRTSLDGAADKFAGILSASVPEGIGEPKRRALAELLYHAGRWIYIVDACDDYKQDIGAGRFNPVAARFPPERGELPETGKARLETTLTHSNNLMCSAFELVPGNVWTKTVENIMYLGMPEVCSRVLKGTWDNGRMRPAEKRNELEL